MFAVLCLSYSSSYNVVGYIRKCPPLSDTFDNIAPSSGQYLGGFRWYRLARKSMPLGAGFEIQNRITSSSRELSAPAVTCVTYCHASHPFSGKIRRYDIVQICVVCFKRVSMGLGIQVSKAHTRLSIALCLAIDQGTNS